MQEKRGSMMSQDRGSRQDIQSLPSQATNVCFCVGACIPRTKPLEAYFYSCSLVISVMSFGTRLHLFPALKSVLSGRHFQGNEEVQQAQKNFLRSLGTDFFQNGFFKLISRYDKCINVGGKYVKK
ncbi:hypothetical protein AVEN_90668-1 [Araneus ventricosus]|uniref:Uncharacterized protein n=1 Tax=Araneus ventricosus TaxID=182803 RepID=A0A4Y2F3N2_ARAVE|nr:hypothetical protein AVEN_90668-1 [Araneus ventricosus]